MDRSSGMAIADRFAAYVGELTKVVGHADRAGPLRDYCSGLLATEGRRSVEPMAAVTAPARVSAQHQKLLHFVANAEWSDEQMLAKVRDLVMPSMTRQGPVESWIIDDTSFPKKGQHSVGVHHQYCGQLGKQANCQVAVTLSIANHQGSLPIAYRLYLPRAWTDDRSRRAQGACAALDQVQDQAADRAGADPRRCGGEGGSRYRADGRKLWSQQWSALGDHGLGAELRGSHHLDRQSAPRARGSSEAEARQRRSLGAQHAQAGLAHHHVARRQQRETSVTLCSRTRACRPDTGRSAVCRRDTADRMAQG